MIPNKILIYYILILQLLTVKSSYVLIDIFFRKIVIKSPNCYNKDVHFEKYRGAITNFDNIEEDFEKTDYDYEVLTKNITHSFLFFSSKEKLLKYINYIPDSSLIFTTFELYYNEIKRDICFIKLDKWSKFHHIFISEQQLIYLTFPLIFCTFFMNITISVYRGYNESLRSLHSYRKIYFYKFVRYTILLSIGIGISAISIYYYLLSYILYSLYKSYLLMNLILLLEGFSIIHFNESEKYLKYISIIFSFDLSISLFGEYIVYILPTLNNFYIFHLKSLIEHTTLLIIIFVYFHKKYIRMYKQYLFEKRMGTILSIGYKIKTIVYLKIMIFSIVYCSSFIIMPFIEMIYIKIDRCVESFYVNYFITICLELVFNLALSILLFPQNLTLYFFLPTIFDYNTFKFKVKIKEEDKDKLNISNLTKSLLKDEYVEKEYPITLITPYSRTDKVFTNLIVGLIKKQKEM
jgi:hypothetical protein